MLSRFLYFSLLGEKLSKQQLQHSNIIKKLRVKEKESDAKISKQQKKIMEHEEELRHLQQVRISYPEKFESLHKGAFFAH